MICYDAACSILTFQATIGDAQRLQHTNELLDKGGGFLAVLHFGLCYDFHEAHA
jgi:hypothetical protein